jgi:hypothetical protein
MQALVVVPTRELAVQIQDITVSIGRHYCPEVACHSLIGGLSLEDDQRKLSMYAKLLLLAVRCSAYPQHILLSVNGAQRQSMSSPVNFPSMHNVAVRSGTSIVWEYACCILTVIARKS